jgi:hypothetical protein
MNIRRPVPEKTGQAPESSPAWLVGGELRGLALSFRVNSRYSPTRPSFANTSVASRSSSEVRNVLSPFEVVV